MNATSVRAKVAGLAMLGLLTGGLPAISGAPAIAAEADVLTGKPGPTLTSPADSRGTETNPLMHVVLAWTPVAGADYYVVQMSPNEDWTNNTVTLPDSGKTVATTYEVNVTLPYASYFWRVKAVDAGGTYSEWSANRVFHHTWFAKPTITLQPTSSNPQFGWTPVTYGSGYVLQLSESGEWIDDGIACYTNHTTVTPYDSTGPEEKTMGSCFSMDELSNGGAGGSFHWRVRAVDGTSEAAIPADTAPRVISECDSLQRTCGPWTYSNTQFVYVPVVAGTPTTPASAAVTCTNACTDTPTFTWPAVAGANEYWVDVALDSQFLNGQREYRVQGTTLTPRDSYFDNQAGLSYHWAVSACSKGLETKVVAIDKATGTVTLSQNGVTDSGQAGETLFSGALRILTVDTTATSPTVTIRVNGKTSTALAVGAKHTSGRVCSPSRLGAPFTKRSAPVTLGSPADGAVVTTKQPTLTWSDYLTTGGAPAQEAKAYRVQVATDAKFDKIEKTVVTDHTQYTRPDALFPDGKYFWRVQAIDESGNGLTWSAVRSFTKDSLEPIVKLREPMALAGYNVLEFSEAVTGVHAASVGLEVADSGQRVSGKVMVVSSKQAVFIPSSPMTAGENYKVWVSSAVKDVVGNAAIASAKIVEAPLVVDSGGGDIQENWDVDTHAAASGDSYIQSGHSGAAVSIPFQGSTFALYGTRATDGGYATLRIDGEARGTVSFFATSRQFQRRLVAIDGLSNGFHTATLTVSGRAPSGSKGTQVYVDRFRTDSGFVEEGASEVLQWWSKRRATDAVGGDYDSTSFVASGDTGSRPSGVASVKGSAVTIVGCKGPDAGKVAIVLDGETVQTVDLYQSYTACGKKVYSRYLSGGAHTIKVVPTGTRNARSSGNRVSIDAIKVTE